MSDQAFREQVLQRITAVETSQKGMMATLQTIDLTTKALHADIIIAKTEQGQRVGASLTMRTVAHFATGVISSAAAILAIRLGIVPNH